MSVATLPSGPRHVEKHFTASDTIADIVLGLADGLTVPFALAAGLSGATIANSIIVTAGLAEIAAGCIAMGLGGYLAARSDAEHYFKERKREWREVKEKPDWINFMMRFELGIEEPHPERALQRAFTIGASYVVGGLIPLSPYMIIGEPTRALIWSIGITLTALFVFGYIKGRFTGIRPLMNAFQMLLVGGLAAAAAFGIARIFSP